MATFITSKLTGETINIYVETSTGYWKYNHNGTDSYGEGIVAAFGNGSQTAEVLNENGEFTIISCLPNGAVSGDITYLDLNNNQLTSFDGTGLSGLTYLDLSGNQLTEFDGTGLSGLTYLNLRGNQLISFDGTPLTSLTYLDLQFNQLTEFYGTGLTSLAELDLNNNQLTSLDVTPMVSLSQLVLPNNLITPQNWDSILSGLVGIGNEGGFLKIGTVQRTNASTADYNTLISRNWVINDTFEIYTPPTFITSKLTGETINIYVETTTSYWKYNHDGKDSDAFNQDYGYQSIEVLDTNGEFTIISCLSDGTVSGDITSLNIQNNQLTSFNGTGLSGLTELILPNNQLTEFDGTGLSGLTGLDLRFNPLTTFIGGDMGLIQVLDFVSITTLTSFDGTGLSSLTTLDLNNNQLTEFDGTGLSGLTDLNLSGNLLTSFIGTGLSSLTTLLLYSNHQLVSFNGTGLSRLTNLGFQDNYQLTTFIGGDMNSIQSLPFGSWGVTTLTSVDVSGLSSLTYLNLNDNPIIASENDSILDQLEANGLTDGSFITIGGRTAAGTADYDTLISRGWTIEGADLVSAVRKLRVKGVGQLNQ
jgi:Leucine-rich repeat (LRR) protein